MFCNTRAIILHHIKYSDNSIILHAYTEQRGRMAFVVNGIKGKKCVVKSGLLTPLSVVELEISYNPNKELHRIKECKNAHFYSSIPFCPIKNSIAFLISEVLFRCLKETDKNEPLFDFLLQSIVSLDAQDKSIANFHLIFLVKLSSFLGFQPNMDNEKNNTYFDMLNGCFLSSKPLHINYLSIDDSDILKAFIANNFELPLSQQQRNNMLENLINYYSLHLAEFGHIKSINVLQTLFV